MRVREYLLENGKSPYQEWFDELDATAAAKVAVAKVRMEAGNTSSIKWFAGIGEYKIDFGPGYRIYLAKEGEDLIILFGGGTKKSQAADIANAKRLHKEYKERKKQSADEKKKKKKRE
jgi:putative addiction module killer protein